MQFKCKMAPSSSPKFTKGFVGLFINFETVCSDAVKKQDGNTCYKE